MDETSSLDDLRLFTEVARRRSFVDAARRTGVPLSTVSRRVARLEAALGTRLLQRTSRQVVPTQEGERLLARAGPMLEELAAILDGSSDEPSGVLRVTAPVVTGSEWVAPALLDFVSRHPRVELDLVLTNSVLDLLEERIDLAIRVGPIRDRELVARRLRAVRYGLCASPELVERELGGRTRLRPESLQALPAIVSRAGAAWRLRRADGSIEELRPRERMRVNDPRVALRAAKRGLGVAALPAELIERHADALVPIAIVGRTLAPRELFAVYPARRQLPARVRGALDWLLERR